LAKASALEDVWTGFLVNIHYHDSLFSYTFEFGKKKNPEKIKNS